MDAHGSRAGPLLTSAPGRDWRRSRARSPEVEGFIERDGVRVFYEVFGSAGPNVLILPTWSVLHAAHGRFQIADLARDHRVITFDPRGNGRSDRPRTRDAYAGAEFVADALAVLDATGTDRAFVLACSLAVHWLVQLAAEHPERVLGVISSGSNLPLASPDMEADDADSVPFDAPYRSTEGWAKFNAAYWRDDYRGFLRWFFEQVWTEPHSDEVIDECVGWGLETDPETLALTVGANPMTAPEAEALLRGIRCPMLVIHGANDIVTPVARSIRQAEITGAELVVLEGAGHCSGNRDPVRFNLLVREFIARIQPVRRPVRHWVRAAARSRSVLFVPPAIGTASIPRDLAIASSLRALHPGVSVEWLAGPSSRRLLEDRGERIHPANADLPGEADVSDLTMRRGAPEPFEASRRADEHEFVAFMVLLHLAAQEPIDLVVADGHRGVDRHLHENPELKAFAYAWMTDDPAWTLARGDAAGRARRSRANAEMLDQVTRYPRVRDRAIFFGAIEDVPTAPLGPGLPTIREWTERHFQCVKAVSSDRDSAGALAVARALAQLL